MSKELVFTGWVVDLFVVFPAFYGYISFAYDIAAIFGD